MARQKRVFNHHGSVNACCACMPSFMTMLCALAELRHFNDLSLSFFSSSYIMRQVEQQSFSPSSLLSFSPPPPLPGLRRIITPCAFKNIILIIKQQQPPAKTRLLNHFYLR